MFKVLPSVIFKELPCLKDRLPGDPIMRLPVKGLSVCKNVFLYESSNVLVVSVVDDFGAKNSGILGYLIDGLVIFII